MDLRPANLGATLMEMIKAINQNLDLIQNGKADASGIPVKVSQLENDKNYATQSDVLEKMSVKVDKETGKGLSSNDFTDAQKQKLDELTPLVACSCAYDAQANTFRLTKLYPNQETGDFFTVTFIPDRDYAAGAALSLDGETYHTRYENLPQDVAVESGEFRAGLCTILNFQKFPGVLNPV